MRINNLTMPELLTYTPSDFSDLASLMQELSGSIVFTRESLDRMLAVTGIRKCSEIGNRSTVKSETRIQ